MGLFVCNVCVCVCLIDDLCLLVGETEDDSNEDDPCGNFYEASTLEALINADCCGTLNTNGVCVNEAACVDKLTTYFENLGCW